MKALKMVVNKLNVAETVKQGKAIYDKSAYAAVVASTKSENILKDELNAKDIRVIKSDVSDLFIDEKAIRETIATAVGKMEIDEILKASLVDLLMSGMDKVCAFKRNK